MLLMGATEAVGAPLPPRRAGLPGCARRAGQGAESDGRARTLAAASSGAAGGGAASLAGRAGGRAGLRAEKAGRQGWKQGSGVGGEGGLVRLLRAAVPSRAGGRGACPLSWRAA
jgi:hypothetical protein